MDRTKIVVLCGPTATGKTAIAVEVALALAAAGRPGEVINADSTQVYRGLDLGTAKPTDAERGGVPHHLFDVRDPDRPLSAAVWAGLADAAIAAIVARGGAPIVVGGTGFYLKALLRGLFAAPDVAPEIRARLARRAAEPGGYDALRARLERDDPASAATIHRNDRMRTLRALEVLEASGRTIGELRDGDPAWRGGLRYDALQIGLDLPRPLLYARIDARQAEQVRAGLLDEYRRLLASGLSPELKALNGLCYRHMRWVHEGRMSLDEALALDARDNRRYAKRQLTWFRRQPGIRWFDPRSDRPAILEAARRHVAGA